MTRLVLLPLLPLLVACSREPDDLVVEVTCSPTTKPVDTAPPSEEAEEQVAVAPTYVEWTDSGIVDCDVVEDHEGLVILLDTLTVEAWSLVRITSSGREAFVPVEDVSVEEDGIYYIGGDCYSEIAVYLRIR